MKNSNEQEKLSKNNKKKRYYTAAVALASMALWGALNKSENMSANNENVKNKTEQKIDSYGHDSLPKDEAVQKIDSYGHDNNYN